MCVKKSVKKPSNNIVNIKLLLLNWENTDLRWSKKRWSTMGCPHKKKKIIIIIIIIISKPFLNFQPICISNVKPYFCGYSFFEMQPTSFIKQVSVFSWIDRYASGWVVSSNNFPSKLVCCSFKWLFERKKSILSLINFSS
jgi:hypothetical protein